MIGDPIEELIERRAAELIRAAVGLPPSEGPLRLEEVTDEELVRGSLALGVERADEVADAEEDDGDAEDADLCRQPRGRFHR
ncbi:MAG: hypothetical protein ACR652_10880 [Methylocystis sp.]|uniref:hypothetical protein n=1 Tax=Methylocystis sp. TaxID=1911079 RepID=UPI003DA1FB02